MTKTAVILAAGMGTRLGELNNNLPKGLLEVGEKNLIQRSVDALRSQGIKRIVIGTGFREDAYKDYFKGQEDITFLNNPDFDSSGSLYTLYLLKKEIGDNDFLLLESDILYEPRAIKEILSDSEENIILASSSDERGDEVFIDNDSTGRFKFMSKKTTELENVEGELVGITKLNAKSFELICQFYQNNIDRKPELHYEDSLNAIAAEVFVKVLKIDNLQWCEIDNSDHLSYAQQKVLPAI